MSTLTPAQLPALNTAIEADATLNALPNDPVGNETIKAAFNVNQVPDWWAWKSRVSISEIATCFNGTELAGLTANNHTRLATIAAWFADGMNPSLSDMRQMLDDIFSGTGGANTRSRLLVMYKRIATRAEKLYTGGTGTNAAPATLTYEGFIDYQDVESARNLG